MSNAPTAEFQVDDLFRQHSVREFFERHYLKLPFASAQGCESACRLADWETCVRLAADARADVLIGRGGDRWPGPLPQDDAELRRILEEGYTLGVRHVDRLDETLGHLAASFRAAFAAPVDVHLYCTPAGHGGFGWHYDAEDVFVLQTAGDKEWRLRKNTVHPWPHIDAIPADQRFERETMPVLSCRLAAGDWLYIPAGYWHTTQAGAESISLSVGLRSTTAIDVFDRLRPRLLDSIFWRQRLPCTGALAPTSRVQQRQELRELFRDLVADLAEQLLSADFVEEFFATQPR
jgi:ribosomal protein L16 Arg81 hydroxylase